MRSDDLSTDLINKMRRIRGAMDRAERFFSERNWELMSLNLLQAGDVLDSLIGAEDRARQLFEQTMTKPVDEPVPPGTVP